MSENLSTPNALIAWLKDNGGHFHPSAELKVDRQTGLSVFSTASIGPDERLVSCPFDLAITAYSATQAIIELRSTAEADLVWPAGSSKAGERWNERMRIGAYLGLHWVYTDSQQPEWPSALRHRTYLESLPKPADLTTPLYFSEPELELLSGTNLLGAVEDRKREWKAESDVVRAVLGDEGLTWERYLATATYMSSRAFPSKLLKLPGDGSAAEHAADKEDEEVSQPVLLPGVDIFNHTRGQPILWLSSLTATTGDSTLPTISLVSTTSTEAGVQLYNNYGAKPNEELLLGYGFVLPSNPDDIVNLRLGTASLPTDVVKRLELKGLDAGKRFELRRDGEVDKGLLEVLRVMLGDASDEEEPDEEDEHALHEHEERGMQVELDVLGMLGGMLDDKLDKLQAGSETQVKGARKEVVEMCKVYRQGQIDILNAAMDKLSERIDRIEGLMDEGMGGCPCGC
ncbi:hypothetical protein IAU60_002756 [Kwoniella sp. DSM 27419]